MSGTHDLGGRPGFGPVAAETNEPVFHHAWERRAFALTIAAGCLGRWNLDMSRAAREEMPSREYLATSYYEHWLFGLERLLERNRLVWAAEIQDRKRDPRSGYQAVPVEGLRILRKGEVQSVLRDPRGARVEDPHPSGFQTGDWVRVRPLSPPGHTRLPRYCRGKLGRVESDHGVWVFPDSHATGQGKKPQHVYSVRFSSDELWGREGRAGDCVFVDLWEDYLEPALCPV